MGLMASAGFLTDHAVRFGETDVHVTLHQWDALLRRLELKAAIGVLETLEPLRVVVCLKYRNLGKLQSHSLFFDIICRELQPTYCFQIDCATTLAEGALLKLVERMERAPDVAAVAPRILPKVPDPGASFLEHWQYLDCALQKGILWPFEVATGHLSVIPGQACALRWAALQGPLDLYLLGTQTEAPFDRVMYLAEDRVIGNQIVLTKHSRWKLIYAPEAEAATDRCARLSELLRQRRRWRNGALACRVWLLGQWRQFLLRTDRSAASKMAFSVAMTSQLLLLLLEFFAPAQLLALTAVLLKSFAKADTARDRVIQLSLIASLAVDVLFVWAAGQYFGRGAKMIVAGRCALGLLSTALLIAAVISAMPSTAAILILLAPAIAVPAVLLALPPVSLTVLARMKFFPLIELGAISVLSSYALWNFHDISWGTKGLTHSSTDLRSGRVLKRWRNILFGSWVAVNVLATIVAITLQGFILPSLNPVVEIAGIADAITAGVALAYLALSPSRFGSVRQ
jgi:cellulose synthase/poly-beta-1,6-N-acetylglucosamine synthase-like glycosyltransferase